MAEGQPSEGTLERLDAIDAEYRRRADDMRRIEERLARLELRVEGMAPRTELGALRNRVDDVDEQLRALEERLGG